MPVWACVEAAFLLPAVSFNVSHSKGLSRPDSPEHVPEEVRHREIPDMKQGMGKWENIHTVCFQRTASSKFLPPVAEGIEYQVRNESQRGFLCEENSKQQI